MYLNRLDLQKYFAQIMYFDKQSNQSNLIAALDTLTKPNSWQKYFV